MFGAIRNEPDSFSDAFLAELRVRPDLFYVVTRSETDPGRQVQGFGGSGTKTLTQMRMRMRTFEAPPADFNNRPPGQGDWNIIRSAVDVLYGSKPLVGYLAKLDRGASAGWFFHFKRDRFKSNILSSLTLNLGGTFTTSAGKSHGLRFGLINSPLMNCSRSMLLNVSDGCRRHMVNGIQRQWRNS